MHFFSTRGVRNTAFGLGLLSLVGLAPVQTAAFEAEQYWSLGETVRLAGEDRYETATKVAEYEFGAPGIASRILVVSGENFPDALVAGPVANKSNIPIVLTKKNELPESSRRFIKWVFDGVNDTESDIWLVGGVNAISDQVVSDLKAIHPNIDVERIQGQDRFETASNIAWLAFLLRGKVPNGVFIVDAYSFPDALAASAPAGDASVDPELMPILLTDGAQTSLHPMVRANLETYLQGGLSSIYIVGGPSAVNPLVSVEINALIAANNPSATLQTISGNNRYSTAKEVASLFYGNVTTLFSVSLANGENFADALVGATDTGRVAAAQGEQAFLLTRPNSLPSETEDFLRTYDSVLTSGVIYGGTSAVSPQVEQQVETYL